MVMNMTTDEAIEVIEHDQTVNYIILNEALDMAIEALKNTTNRSYLIRTEDNSYGIHRIKWRCANCNVSQDSNVNYCSNCGAKIIAWKEENENDNE